MARAPRAVGVLRGVGLACALLVAGAAGVGAAEGAAPEPAGGVQVGDLPELDLDRLRALAGPGVPGVRDPAAFREAPEGVRRVDLATAVDLALTHNPSIRIARAERDSAAREVPAARARFHPVTGLRVGAEESDLGGSLSTQAARGFVRQEVPTGGSVTLSSDFLRSDLSGRSLLNEGALAVEVRQPLMRGGRPYVARREIDDATYNFDIEDAQLDAEILRVTRDTKVAYYESILASRLIQVTAAAVERDQRLIEASEALFGAARASLRDVVSARIRLSDDLTRLAERRAELRQARLELRDVMGLPLGDRVGPAESSVTFRPVEMRVGEWVRAAVARRPEARELRTQLAQSTLALRVSSNDVLPKLDVLGLYRRADRGGSMSRALDLGGQRWNVGLEFEIPFANVAARERLAAARSDHSRAERELDRQLREIEREVRSEVIDLRRNLAAVTLQADKVESSRAKLEVAVERYRLGVANNLDIIDAQADLLDAETDLLTAIFDYTKGLARLEASTGGPI